MILEKKPLVTIVTITFNLIKSGREKTFRQCLESVHAQTYENFEHVVIDGGSKDGTVELIKEYANKGWIKYISEPDSGIYDAMNKGIEMAKGKYVGFLNSDDFYHDTRGVEVSVNALEKTNADFSYAPVINFDENNNTKKTNFPDMSKVFFSIVPNHQTMFLSREMMINEGMFDTNFKCIADYDMTVRLCLKKYKSVFVETIFSTYRLGGFSLEATNNGAVSKEAAEIYFNNYSKLLPITRVECDKLCKNIYRGNFDDVPLKLAKKLRDFEPYFNFKAYRKSQKIESKILKKINSVFHGIFAKLHFILFSPKKFTKKYFNKLFN